MPSSGWTPPGTSAPLPGWVDLVAGAVAFAIIMEAFVVLANLAEWASGR